MTRFHSLSASIEKIRGEAPLRADKTRLLGASKDQPPEILIPFLEDGLKDFGENRVQEAEKKWPALKKRFPDVTLHLIGPLQTNKVKEALALFDVIQTLDRPKLADAIAKELRSERYVSTAQQANTGSKKMFIQVNTGNEPQKAGISPAETGSFIRYCQALRLNVVGLMCVPPANAMPAPHFALLRKLALENGLKELSMGMSGDYETAIRMGSSYVRIGTALFGKRLA